MMIFENITKEQIKIRIEKGKKGVYSWKSVLPGQKVELPENYASNLKNLYGGKENVVEIPKKVSVEAETKKEDPTKKEKVDEKPKKKESVKKSLVSSIKKAVGMK